MCTNNNTNSLSFMFNNTELFSIKHYTSKTLSNGRVVSIFEAYIGTLKDNPEEGILKAVQILQLILDCPVLHFHEYAHSVVNVHNQELDNAYFYTYVLNEEYIQIYLFK